MGVCMNVYVQASVFLIENPVLNSITAYIFFLSQIKVTKFRKLDIPVFMGKWKISDTDGDITNKYFLYWFHQTKQNGTPL